ncbi:MAG TPA: hypothetical protein VL854_07995, partial [Nitrososphaeraceae archaeon]|nr:hypothetical protein [Nitrososphaeraceae archaeon]
AKQISVCYLKEDRTILRTLNSQICFDTIKDRIGECEFVSPSDFLYFAGLKFENYFLDVYSIIILNDEIVVDSFNILNCTSIISLMLKVILCLPRGVCVYHRMTNEIVSPTDLT